MKYQPLDSSVYINNRRKFASQLEKNSIAIFHSNDEMPRSGDSFHSFRQHADLFYLTGIDQEETTLILFPDCPLEEYREVLLLRQTNEIIAIWEGHKYTIEEAQQTSGIRKILWNEDVESILHMLMIYADHVYLDLNENYRMKYVIPDRNHRLALQLMERFPLHTYRRSGPIMLSLRQIKSDAEVAQIKEAIRVTDIAFRRVLGFVRPGVTEYEVEAEITHEFLRNRMNGHAYSPIIASGKNSCVLHYVANSEPCKEGDVLLLDFGADYGNYAADLTRTIPVSGKFSKRQRRIYDAVLRVMRGAMKLLKPGTIIQQYHEAVGEMMTEELLNLRLLRKSDIKNQTKERPAYKKYFMHGTSHHLGIDVHDLGTRFDPIKPGMVFTCEPGIYIPEENIGIRIENDLLVTKNGNTDLMGMIPIEAEEIEELMRSKK
ncbi:MAG: aminopeptidase P N-terminal domain-containing protein [Chitinophagales bacterium]|nr:aminopeptidase P N-terminal domain-containing protein [Chitinophagales bacterium]